MIYNKVERNLLEKHFCPEHVVTRFAKVVDISNFLFTKKLIYKGFQTAENSLILIYNILAISFYLKAQFRF